MKRCLKISAAMLVGSVCAACSYNPATGENQMLWVPADQTAAMGEAAKPELVKEYGGEVESTPLRNYVSGVGRRLLEHVEPEYADLKWEFTTLDSDVINAFALPGGKVFMSRGLLEQFDSEAEVAGVLGHEIGHVTGRHVDARITQAMGVELIGSIASAAVGDQGAWSQAVPAIVGMGGQGYLLKFGRDQESQADELGLKYMVRAGYDPEGMLDVLKVLMRASEGGGAPPEILSTHPNPERRHREAKAIIEREYASTINNPQYKKHEDRFQRGAAPHLNLKGGTARLEAVPAMWCAHCRAGSAPPPWR